MPLVSPQLEQVFGVVHVALIQAWPFGLPSVAPQEHVWGETQVAGLNLCVWAGCVSGGVVEVVAGGSVEGGFLGSKCMDLLGTVAEQNIIRCVQAFILASLIAAVCFYVSKERKSFHVENNAAIIIVGLSLGFLASFLGIGGGPINVAVLTLFFSMNVKESAVYSVAIIFFSQITKLITMFATSGIDVYSHQWKTLLFILPAAVLGGITGSKFNRIFDDKFIRKVFVAVMILIVILNLYNGITYLSAAL